MPSAKISASNMSQLVRDTYQANGLIRSHGQSAIASSQTSLQKLPASSPQLLYQQLNCLQQQTQQSMQFPPPPMQTQQQQQQQQQSSNNVNHSLVPTQNSVQQHHQPNKSATESVTLMNHQYNQMIVPQQQQQLNRNLALNIMSMNAGLIPANMNGASQNQLPIPPFIPAKSSHMQQPMGASLSQQIQQHPTYMTQQHILAAGQQHPQNQNLQQQAQSSQQQQVPMTSIMIPATTASQLQSISMQIQQAAMQAAPNIQQTPQILVFMIPYAYHPNNLQVPSLPITPEQPSLNSTLVRQSGANSPIIRRSQQQQQHQQPAQIISQQPQPQPQQQQQSHRNPPPTAATSTGAQSRAVSSLSNNTSSTLAAKQESEKFYVKANFSYRASRNRQALSFQKGEILHVLDTLQNNDYGVQYWLATRVNHNGEDTDKGLIPNKNKAEEIAIEQRTMEISERASGENGGGGGVVGRVNFLKRRSAQRSKSLSKDNWDNVVFDIGTFRLPTYERVVFKHPGFCRPVVIFGPLADLAREKLLNDYPEKYSYPTGISQSPEHPKVIRLKGVLDVIDQGKHALLDITAQAVEKLNYVNLAPIVIFMKSESKSIIKEFRTRAAESLDPSLAREEDTLRRDSKSSRKLLEQSMQLEKQWSHVFTALLDLSTMGSEMWYRKLREIIENQQSANVWMGDKRSSERHQQMSATASSSNLSAHGTANESPYSTSTNSRNSNHHQHQHSSKHKLQQSAACLAENSSMLNEKFNECLNLTTAKSTNDLLPVQDTGIYGNRSKLRNDYVHSLAQKLARASSEPKLNGALSEPEDEDDDDDDEDEGMRLMQHQQRVGAADDDEDDEDDDEIAKKPLFPNERDNSSSISSNGMGSSTGGPMNFGQFSLSGASSSAEGHMQSAPYQQQTSASYQMHLAPPQLVPHNHIAQKQSKPPAPLPPQAVAQAQAQAFHTAIGQSGQQQQHLNHHQSATRSMIATEDMYSMNNGGGSVIGVDSVMPMMKSYSNTSGAARIMSHNRDYHQLPPMGLDNGYYQQQQQQQVQSLTGSGQTNTSTSSNSSAGQTDSSTPTGVTNTNSDAKNNAENQLNISQQSLPIDLARNHETRGSGFHIYTDMNQNNYHYFNVNKI